MSWHWYHLTFPRELDPKAVLHFTRTLAVRSRHGLLRTADPVVVEAHAHAGRLHWLLGVTERDHRQVLTALRQALPDLHAEPAARPDPLPVRAWELRLSSKRRALRTDAPEQVAGAVLAALAEAKQGETAVLQWLIGPWLPRPVVSPVTVSRRSNNSILDLGRLVLDSEQAKVLRDKHAEPLFGVVGRLAITAASPARQAQLRQAVIGALQLLRAPGIGLERRLLPSGLAARRLHRLHRPLIAWPCVLNAAELAASLGWPIGNPVLPGVHYGGHRQLPPAVGTVIRKAGQWDRVTGRASYPGTDGWLNLPPAEALHHLHVLGPTGVGKSTLIAGLAVQDIAAGRTVVVIDPSPKGDLIRDIADRVPAHRLGDVVLLDPADHRPVGLNVLAGEPVDVTVDTMLHIIHELYAAHWGPRTADILRNALTTLTVSRLTLCELGPLLTSAPFRRKLVAEVGDDHLGTGPFWAWFEALSENERASVIGPVMNKLRAFTGRPAIRGIIGQTGGLHVEDVFSKRRILLVSLAAGQIGSEAAQLLGALLVGQLWLAIQRRSTLLPEEREPAFVYLDEFQNVMRLPLDLGDALVVSRGLGVGLTLGHQHLAQLSPAMRTATLANARSKIVFQLGHDDAAVMAKHLGGSISSVDLQQLGRFETYQALLNPKGHGAPASASTSPLGPPLGSLSLIRQRSAEHYGRSRAETDADLLSRRVGLTAAPDSAVGLRRRRTQ